MNPSTDAIVAFLCVFARCSAMLMVSPFAGQTVPPKMRALLAAALAICLAPVVEAPTLAIDAGIFEFGAMIAGEVAVGLLIGMTMQWLVVCAQMAGSLLDLNIGLSSAQMFDPNTGASSTPVARFYHMLAIAVLLALNAHHTMIGAFVWSYTMPMIGFDNLETLATESVALIGRFMLIALQIASPVMAVGFLIDAAAGLLNKAIPQTIPFLMSLPAKLALGMVLLGLGLPAVTTAVRVATDQAFEHIEVVLGREEPPNG